jgi:ectoine hydroxylase-related dioxygenase (phytanoyl-CoA dioxygenase family)
MPIQSKLNTFDNYCVVHEKFMWDVRTEPGVIDAFAKVWGTDKLLVSFDSLNVTFPGREDKPARPPWPHVDQSPYKKGLHCIQGIVNLSKVGPEDGSLMVLPRSNTFNEEFFATQTDQVDWPKIDWRRFSEDEMKWFASKGLKPVKVEAEPGDLILWDSRTVHWGGEPTPASDVIRTVIYVSMSPASFATKEALAEKARVFNVHGATTHWAHDNIFLRPLKALLPDGTEDPRNRDAPLEMAEQSDRLLKLAGIIPY